MNKTKKALIIISLVSLMVLAVHTAEATFISTHSIENTLDVLGFQQAVAYSCCDAGIYY